ncbi:hypothetical protein [Paenibacillus solani]|uniref:hypothetical protein n=1 Tax=Paenibacillus solani TaxID=1705565 RepID=UPI003D296EF7
MTVESLKGIHTYIEKQMKAWKVPEVSVAVRSEMPLPHNPLQFRASGHKKKMTLMN